MSIKIMLADDHAVFRSGLRALLEKAPGVEVVVDDLTEHPRGARGEPLAPVRGAEPGERRVGELRCPTR